MLKFKRCKFWDPKVWKTFLPVIEHHYSFSINLNIMLLNIEIHELTNRLKPAQIINSVSKKISSQDFITKILSTALGGSFFLLCYSVYLSLQFTHFTLFSSLFCTRFQSKSVTATKKWCLSSSSFIHLAFHNWAKLFLNNSACCFF